MAYKMPAPQTARRHFVTPEGVDLQIELGSRGARVGAFLLDQTIIVTLIALNILLSTLFGQSGDTSFYAIWLIGAFVLRNGWFILFELGGRGATLGKRVMKLRVVARDGARLTAGAVIARNALREIEIYLPLTLFFSSLAAMFTGEDVLLPLLALAWGMVFLLFPLFNRDRLRMGDIVAGTWVVQSAKAELGYDLVQPLPQYRRTFTDAQLDLYGVYELQTLEDVLRRADHDAVQTVAYSIRNKAGLPHDGFDYEFLSDYYAALCARLERGLMVGQRRADKFSEATRAPVLPR